MISKEKLKSLFNELDPKDDKETWDKKVNKIMDALGTKRVPVETETSDIKDAIKKNS